jgi:sulfatase modifying factor 1
MKFAVPAGGVALLLAAAISPYVNTTPTGARGQRCLSTDGAAQIPAGLVALGEDGPGRPGVETKVDAFDIDRHEVTNRQFAAFIAATGYRTQAERDDAGAVFVQPTAPPASENAATWWRLIKGANWYHPMGPGSENQPDLPVVQVTYEDALAYANWAGRRLPEAAEWERAARGNRTGEQATSSWAYAPDGKPTANSWQGTFPLKDTGEDGFKGIAPVGCFSPNGFGLYDMIGNVWEWTNDARQDGKHVVRGGSYLCAANYCANFRPAGWQAQEDDLPTSHIGFRTAAQRSR